MSFTNEGRLKGAAHRKLTRAATPATLSDREQASAEFARRMGNRRYDEEGMVVKLKKGVKHGQKRKRRGGYIFSL